MTLENYIVIQNKLRDWKPADILKIVNSKYQEIKVADYYLLSDEKTIMITEEIKNQDEEIKDPAPDEEEIEEGKIDEEIAE